MTRVQFLVVGFLMVIHAVRESLKYGPDPMDMLMKGPMWKVMFIQYELRFSLLLILLGCRP